MAKPEVLTNVVDFGDNPYLIGPHEPIREELETPEPECIGEIPEDFLPCLSYAAFSSL